MNNQHSRPPRTDQHSRPPRTHEQMVKETWERSKRIETRLTSYLESQGHATQAEKPIWHTDGVVTLPSPRTSIRDVMAMIPVGNRDDVEVYLGQDCVAIIRRP